MSQRIADLLEVLDLIRVFARESPKARPEDWRGRAIAHVASRGVTTNTVFAHVVGKNTRFLRSAHEFDQMVASWIRGESDKLQEWVKESSLGEEPQRISQLFSGTSAPTPVASDIEEPEATNRHLVNTYRILRDTALARRIKADQKFTCQICSTRIVLGDGSPYAEAHHVKPLGAPHNGPDHPGNIVCLCPNCHVMFDYGAIFADPALLANVHPNFIHYHNTVIFQKRA